MIAAVPETKLSLEIHKIGETLDLVSLDELPEIGRLLIKLAELAHVQEMELQILRDMEAGRELRVGLRQAIDAQFAASIKTASGNVIFNEFGKKS